MRALFLLSSNQYGVVSHFFNGIKAELIALGFDVDYLHTDTKESISQSFSGVYPIDDYHCMFSFNGLGLGEVTPTFNTLRFAKTKPVYVFCVDHPLHLMERFYGHPIHLLCVAKEHVAFAQMCGIKASYFPHAINRFFDYPETPVENKNSDVLFPVSFLDEVELKRQLEPFWSKLGPLVENSDTVTTFLKGIGVIPTETSPSRTQFNENIRQIARLVDKYLRAVQRRMCLEDFAHNGVKLNVVGRNVQQYKTTVAYHDYQESVEFEPLLIKMSQASYVVHQSPGFEAGLHERVVYPLVCNTPVICWNANYAEATFANNGTVGFNCDRNTITAEQYASLVTKGKNKVYAQYTWATNLSHLIEI